MMFLKQFTVKQRLKHYLFAFPPSEWTSLRRHHKSLAVQIGLQTQNSKHIRGVQRDKLLFTFTKIPTPKFDEILESSSPPHTHTHTLSYPTSLVLRFRILRALQETGEAWPP